MVLQKFTHVIYVDLGSSDAFFHNESALYIDNIVLPTTNPQINTVKFKGIL